MGVFRCVVAQSGSGWLERLPCKPGLCFPPWLAMQGGTRRGWLSLQAVTHSVPPPPAAGWGAHSLLWVCELSLGCSICCCVLPLAEGCCSWSLLCASPHRPALISFHGQFPGPRVMQLFLIVLSFVLAPLCPLCGTAVGGSQAVTANNWGVWCTLTVLYKWLFP